MRGKNMIIVGLVVILFGAFIGANGANQLASWDPFSVIKAIWSWILHLPVYTWVIIGLIIVIIGVAMTRGSGSSGGSH